MTTKRGSTLPYNYTPLRDAVERILCAPWSRGERFRAYTASAIFACAVIDHGLMDMKTQEDCEAAYARAWEDFGIALRGFGSAFLTGAVVEFWLAVPKDRWEEARKVLNAALLEAENTTSDAVVRQYLKPYYLAGVRTPDEGYPFPTLLPVYGKRAYRWVTEVLGHRDEGSIRRMMDKLLCLERRYRSSSEGLEDELIGEMDPTEKTIIFNYKRPPVPVQRLDKAVGEDNEGSQPVVESTQAPGLRLIYTAEPDEDE